MLNPCKHSQHTNTIVEFIRLLFFLYLTYACIMQGCFVPCLIVWRLLHVSHLDFEHQTCYAIHYSQILSKHFSCCLLREYHHLVLLFFVSSSWALLKWFFGLASTFLVYVNILGSSFGLKWSAWFVDNTLWLGYLFTCHLTFFIYLAIGLLA